MTSTTQDARRRHVDRAHARPLDGCPLCAGVAVPAPADPADDWERGGYFDEGE